MAHSFEELIEGLNKRFDKEFSDAKEMRFLNVSHKRDWIGDISNLITGEIAALIALKLTEIELNVELWLTSFLILSFTLLFIQIYIYLLLYSEGESITFLEKELSPIHTEFFDTIEEEKNKGKTLADITLTMYGKTPEIYKKHFKRKEIREVFSKTISSEIWPILIVLLYLIGSASLILSIELLTEFLCLYV